jgi:diguanylate cyclase (GGDEF)-like protein/PAS domain S-box-containing protein
VPTVQGESFPELTASDVLSAKLWQSRAERPPLGIDLACTKIAVDFQNITAGNADAVIRQSLDILREATSTDAVFLALLDGHGERIDSVAVAKGPFAQCRPEVLKGEALDALPWIRSRLEHVRILEIRDTVNVKAEQASDSERLAGLDIRSLLLIAFAVQGTVRGFLAFVSSSPRDGWDVNLHLLLKLVGTSLACGLEKVSLADRLADMQERQEMALPCANDGLWDYDAQTNFTWFSPRWKGMLGFAENDVITSPDWHRMVHPEDLARVSAAMRDHIAGKTPMFESVHRLKHTDGEWRWVIGRACARVDDQGRLRRLIGVELDITERKLYEEALFREKESAQITLQSIGDGVITCDAHGRVEYLNPVAEELTGWRLEDSLGRTIDEIFRAFHEETCEPLENPLAVAVRRIRSIKSVRPMLLIRKDGNELYIESTASPIRDGTGTVTGGVLVFHDVSESRELNRRLSYHASHDVLTGLVNRREFETRLERALKSAKARETSYALCYIDLDQFKIVNDTCGHSAGDALLGQVGALLKSKVRWRDTLARLGGDEFGVLLESCSLEEALRTAESLREAIRNFRYTWEDRSFRLGCSIGVVPITAENEDVASVLSAADSACGAAKESGRNRVHCFEENDIDLMRRRREMQWAARINNALEESRFELFRMTILPLQKEDAGEHFELLLRMRDESGKIVAPDQFIAAAERYGITPSIDRWVIDSAFRWLVSEADERKRLAMCSINLSGQSLGDDKFLPYVIEQFHRSGLDGSKICFEITGDRGDRELLAGEPLHPGAQGARLQVRARRLRHGPLVVRLPEALPGGLPENRRQLRQGRAARPDRPRDGPLDQRDRPPDRQADDRRVG